MVDDVQRGDGPRAGRHTHLRGAIVRRHDARVAEQAIDSRPAGDRAVEPMDNDLMTIGQFARLSGLTIRMLRDYHKAGLLVPAQTNPYSRYRRYRRDQLDLAWLIRELRWIGLADASPAITRNLSAGSS
jgi:MerR family regulatory protein